MKTLSLACTVLLALTAHVASAGSSIEETRQHVVSYADLDLDNDADAAALLLRIRVAARVVCGAPGPEWMPLASLMRVQRCSEQAAMQALESVRVRSAAPLANLQ
jgi:UrcA family protein